MTGPKIIQTEIKLLAYSLGNKKDLIKIIEKLCIKSSIFSGGIATLWCTLYTEAPAIKEQGRRSFCKWEGKCT